ncbi:hypothetical protein BJF85_20260 [Saccharomonospora sp. CUA-673]|uniref:hypothetical protein n=1 Tax=Saccharomonospora sp. CUA-673 TaxID=1904969 RepID=UPI000960103A|nr:hypothetical protein [Saccharomonospora sp. CUA-673]OLT44211.1 hypothetical protein BJF85_20260 [Saccharomonospora sp. CUA-673]
MLRRQISDHWPSHLLIERVLFLLLALAFAATATLQLFLADSMSVWWPIVLAVLLALAALLCLYVAVRAGESDKHAADD